MTSSCLRFWLLTNFSSSLFLAGCFFYFDLLYFFSSRFDSLSLGFFIWMSLLSMRLSWSLLFWLFYFDFELSFWLEFPDLSDLPAAISIIDGLICLMHSNYGVLPVESLLILFLESCLTTSLLRIYWNYFYNFYFLPVLS